MQRGRAFMHCKHHCISLVAFGFLLPSCPSQTQAAEAPYPPPPDPGYGLYFHDSQLNPNLAARWGYNDGWEDGRRDRNHGETVDDPTTKSRYTTPPEHSGHPGMTRETFIKQFRAAYLRGYKHGSRL